MQRNLLEPPPFYHTPETVAQVSSILTHVDGYQWLLNNYLTVYFHKTNTHAIIEGFFDADKMWDCPFIEYSSVFRNDLLLLNNNIISYFKELIYNGNYINLLINHFYVKGSSIYKKKNLGHTALLSGYDENSKSFLYSDFSALHHNEYRFFNIDENNLLKSVINCNPENFDYNDSLFAPQFQKKYFEHIQYFKINHEIKYKFNINSFLEQLRCYLSGEPPKQFTFFPCGFYVDNAVWGINILESFLEYLERAVFMHYGWKEIRRFISFLGNIRKLMNLRIEFLKDKYDLENYDLHKERNNNLSELQDILLKAVIINIIRKEDINQENTSHFISILKEYYEKEKIFLYELISSIENKLLTVNCFIT